MAKPPKDTTFAVLNIVGPAKGRWRNGRHFTPDVTTLVLSDLSEAEVGRLRADPELTVIDAVQAVAPAAAEKEAAEAAAKEAAEAAAKEAAEAAAKEAAEAAAKDAAEAAAKEAAEAAAKKGAKKGA